MFKRFMPREGKFFELFRLSAEQSVLAAKTFRRMLDDFDNRAQYAKEIKEFERKGDECVHMTVELLHKTFITPLDRDDIHRLISKLDDILDYIEGASLRVFLYDMKKATPEAKKLADICIESAECVKRIVDKLHDLTFTSGIVHECVEVNRLENVADQAVREAKAQLFRSPDVDTKELIKLKEIYEFLESVTDKCEDVANIVEGIILEYA